jgi:hypothetical protein
LQAIFYTAFEVVDSFTDRQKQTVSNLAGNIEDYALTFVFVEGVEHWSLCREMVVSLDMFV